MGEIGPYLALSVGGMRVLSLVWMAVFCCATALSAAAVPEQAVSGVKMPVAVSVDGRELRLNGMGVRKMHVFFGVYVAGLYLEKPTTDAQVAIATDEAKRIVLVMLRDASRAQFVQAMKTGILRNSGPAMPTLRARLDRLEEALPAVRKGNVLEFTYLPGEGTLVHGEGKEMTIPGKDFADALFSVWLGPKPASEALKRQLLTGPAAAPAASSSLTEPGVEAIGYGHVFHDLSAEEFGRVELFFFADIPEESHFDASGRGIGQGVEQEGFYREFVAIESWSVANIGDRAHPIGARHVDSGPG